MKKTILFLLDREVTYLPPFMAILDALCEDYSLKVISYEKKGGVEHLRKQYEGKGVEFLSTVLAPLKNTFIERIKRRIESWFNKKNAFYKEAVSLIENTPHDLLWVAHEFAAQTFKDYLIKKKFMLGYYELHDIRKGFVEELKPIVKNAIAVIAPEYNRAHIIRAWFNLKDVPYIIPNKPYLHPRERDIENNYSEVLKDKKIILFQGYIQRVRNIDKLCEACSTLRDYTVVLMGKGDNEYIEELKSKYPNIIHIGFVAPPQHLYITSYARIGVVKYDAISLNAIFCAPNKTWEYTGFGIPVLCHNLPGLHYTIEVKKAGVCCDMDNVAEVKNAILEIDKHYAEYSNNAVSYYESFDLKQSLDQIIKKNI